MADTTQAEPDITEMGDSSTKMDEDYKEGAKVDVKGDGGIIKEIKRVGSGWETPTKGSEVKVHYVGTLLNGEKFDSSRDRNDPFVFKLGQGRVIKGWDEGVKTMRKGELSIFTLKPEYAYGESGSPPKIPANSVLVFEVELLSWNSEEDVTKDGLVKKKLLAEGDGFETPKEDSKATINYTAKSNGKVFDQKQGFQLTVGAEEVVEGLDKALETMKKGEKALVTIEGPYSFKETNKQFNVEKDTKIQYEVELVDFTKEKSSWEMNTEEKFAACEKCRSEGNDLFKAGKIDRAGKKYKKALSFVDSEYSLSDEEKAKAKALKVPCLSNIAACKIKTKEWRSVIENSNKVLEIDSNNVKAYFRRGQAYGELDEWEQAKTDLKKVFDLDPNNADAKKEMARLTKKINDYNAKDKKRYQNMFARMSAMESKETQSSKKEEEEEARPAAKSEALVGEAKEEDTKN